MPTNKRATRPPPPGTARASAPASGTEGAPRAQSSGARDLAPKSNHPPGGVRRRDGAGHLNRAYAAELRQIGQNGSIRDATPFISKNYSDDDLAEQLGELAVETATSGEEHALTIGDDNAPEDTIGPFYVAKASEAGDEEE